MHGGSGSGAPKGNENAKGNAGGAPPGNLNASETFLYTDISEPGRVLDYLEENDESGFEFVRSKFNGYLEVARFGPDSPWADQLMQCCLMEYALWKSQDVQIRERMIVKKEVPNPGGPETIERLTENAINLPIDRVQRTLTQRLEKLGVMPSPDQQVTSSSAELHEALVSDLISKD